MSCGQEAQVHAYHDGELGESGRRGVEAHVEQCPACAALLADLEALGAMARAAEFPPLEPAALARFHRAWDLYHQRQVVRTAGWLTAAAAAVLVGSLVLWPLGGGGGEGRVGAWEAVAAMPPSQRAPEGEPEPLAVAQWMANDLSLGQRR